MRPLKTIPWRRRLFPCKGIGMEAIWQRAEEEYLRVDQERGRISELVHRSNLTQATMLGVLPQTVPQGRAVSGAPGAA